MFRPPTRRAARAAFLLISRMIQLKVTQEEPLLSFLMNSLKDFSRTKIKSLLKHRAVFINRKQTSQFDAPLSPGDIVSVETQAENAHAAYLESKLDIVYQDDILVVINKPANLLTIATEKERKQTAYYQLHEYLKTVQKGPQKPVFIVHRLDREVSGLLVFAKTHSSKIWLQDNWHHFRKRYYAIVEGAVKEKSGVLESYLYENKFLKMYSGKPGPDGKKAVTLFERIETVNHYSLLEVELLTGRKHQIRVHLSDMKHPLVGDDKYGAKTDPLKRIALHAYYLEIEHPGTGKKLIFKTPAPPEFSRLLTPAR